MLTPIDKQTVRSWYQYVAEPHVAKLTGRILRATGPRIAVVGNCQSFSIAYAMKLLCPSAKVDHFRLISRSHVSLKIFAKTLATYDYVFSHEFPAGFIPDGGSNELRELLKQMTLIPQIAFAAFHPDCVFVGEDAIRAPVFSPLGGYHSGLALFAFHKGLSLQEANALFNRNVFEALGYFDFWNDASAELLEGCKRDYNIDLSAEFSKWGRRGAFMYTINHPKPFVLFDLARKLLANIGLTAPDIDYEDYMVDDLFHHPIFPIYPPVGAHFGFYGSYTFILAQAQPTSHVVDYLVLPQFLRGSYARYQKYGRERLTNRRVDAWLGDRATSDMIVSLARENLHAGLLPVR